MTDNKNDNDGGRKRSCVMVGSYVFCYREEANNRSPAQKKKRTLSTEESSDCSTTPTTLSSSPLGRAMGRVSSVPSLSGLSLAPPFLVGVPSKDNNNEEEEYEELLPSEERSVMIASPEQVTAGTASGMRISMSAPSLRALSDPIQEDYDDDDDDDCVQEHPDCRLESILNVVGLNMVTIPSVLVDFFVQATEERIAGYGPALVAAVRRGDLDALRRHHMHALQCCNRFGESIVHMVCRRGDAKVLRFLLEEARVNVRVRDDYGRTPLHDACWTQDPHTEVVAMLLRACPDLLYLQDIRGHTPFAYVRRDHWPVWNRFLEQHRHLLPPKELPCLLSPLE